jgi:type IV secretory pathway VirB10-like protein
MPTEFSGLDRAIASAFFAAVLGAGCAGVKEPATPTPAPPLAVEPSRATPPAVPPPATATPSTPAEPTSSSAAPAPAAPSASNPAAKPPVPEAKPAAKSAVAAAVPPAKPAPAAEAAKPKAPPLDLKALETQLKETKAIGVLTKLSLKNQVDDLLSQFRAFYQGKLKTTLAELRRPFDLLVLKLLSLLQDTDPTLAAAIVASREAIWGILSDPVKFASLDGG